MPGWRLYDERRHERHRYLYLGHDPAVCGLAIGAVVQSVRGLGDDALAMERRELLGPVRARFTRGFPSPYVQQADDLLATIR